MKQKADSFSLTTPYQKKKQKKTLQVSQVCTQVRVSITSITRELQGFPGWNYHQAGMNLLFAGCKADLCPPDVLSHWLSFLQANQATETHIRHRSL